MAIARSGHHAVMHWMCSQFPGKIVFFNNCNQELKYRNKHVYANPGQQQGVLYSFENFDLNGFKHYGFGKYFDDVIIINRDPYNLIASSMEKKTKLSVLTETVSNSRNKFIYDKWWCASLPRYDMFFQYMEQCLGEKDYLNRPFYHINYNKWFSDIEYRKQICQDLNLVFTDAGINHVSKRGLGSSFDKLKFSGKGSEMDVLNRWRYYVDDERYQELIRDSRIKYYSLKYFNFNIDEVDKRTP